MYLCVQQIKILEPHLIKVLVEACHVTLEKLVFFGGGGWFGNTTFFCGVCHHLILRLEKVMAFHLWARHIVLWAG